MSLVERIKSAEGAHLILLPVERLNLEKACPFECYKECSCDFKEPSLSDHNNIIQIGVKSKKQIQNRNMTY